jgi:hypothetical protein
MCYEVAIALVGGDEATLMKSLIISLEDAATNWYSRLPPRCIYSRKHLKDKILLKFQGCLHVNLMACVEQSKAMSHKAKPIAFLFKVTKTSETTK